MKGLLIKDLRLTLKNKKLFVILLLMAVFMLLVQGAEGAVFAISYLTFMGSSFVLTTISTDEFDKSTTFVMTLPIQKSTYAVEKYVFSFASSIACWIVGTAVGCVLSGSGAGELIVFALIILAVVLLFQMIILPVQLKFGGEKGRMVLLGIFVVVFALAFGVEKFAKSRFAGAEEAALWLENLLGWATSLNPISITIAAVIFLIICGCISIGISIRIMEKREY